MSTAETNPLETASLSAFTDGLAKLGWTAGQNVAIDVRWGAADARRLSDNARELVSLEPDVLLAKGAANPADEGRRRSIRPHPFALHDLRTPSDFAIAFGAIAKEKVDAFVTDPDPLLVAHRGEIVDFAARYLNTCHLCAARLRILWWSHVL